MQLHSLAKIHIAQICVVLAVMLAARFREARRADFRLLVDILLRLRARVSFLYALPKITQFLQLRLLKLLEELHQLHKASQVCYL